MTAKELIAILAQSDDLNKEIVIVLSTPINEEYPNGIATYKLIKDNIDEQIESAIFLSIGEDELLSI